MIDVQFVYLPPLSDISLSISHLQKKCTPLVANLIERSERAIKPVSKEELNILIKNGIIVRSSNGYIDPETHFVVGHYRTKGGAGRVYIEDMYADKAKKLYLKG